MSRSWEQGSTRGWRQLRLRVLRRDHSLCQLQMPGCTSHATHVDHIVPKSKGGTDHPENLRASCQNCNLARGANNGPRRQKTPPPDPDPTPKTNWS